MTNDVRPFDHGAGYKMGTERVTPTEKRAHPGSNQGPADLQSAALPLSYTPSWTAEFLRIQTEAALEAERFLFRSAFNICALPWRLGTTSAERVTTVQLRGTPIPGAQWLRLSQSKGKPL